MRKTVSLCITGGKSDSTFIEAGNDAFSGSDGERKSSESKKTAGKGDRQIKIIMESRV